MSCTSTTTESGVRVRCGRNAFSPPPPPPRWLGLLSVLGGGSVVVGLLFIFARSWFCSHLGGWGKELVTLPSLSSWCLVVVVWLFPAVPWVCLQYVIVVFPDHTHYFCSAERHRF